MYFRSSVNDWLKTDKHDILGLANYKHSVGNNQLLYNGLPERRIEFSLVIFCG